MLSCTVYLNIKIFENSKEETKKKQESIPALPLVPLTAGAVVKGGRSWYVVPGVLLVVVNLLGLLICWVYFFLYFLLFFVSHSTRIVSHNT